MKIFGKRYLGFRGTKLNIAIGVIAGIDFLYGPRPIRPHLRRY